MIAQLWRRLGRTVALLLGIAVAATSFSVLTGAAEVARLEVRGTVEENFRSTYDLLVRPTGSYTELEAERGLVRPNYQSGIFGGITTDQLGTIRAIDGVEVAAPVANLGYVDLGGGVTVSVKPFVVDADQQLFRIRPTWSMDRGLSRFVGAPSYVYVSRNPTVVLARIPYTRGADHVRDYPTYAERVPGRRDPVPNCTNYQIDKTATQAESGRDEPFGYRDPYATTGPLMTCYYLSTEVPSSLEAPQGAGDPTDLDTVVEIALPTLLTAIDPEAEARLFGLDQAVVSGQSLTTPDLATTGTDGNPRIPVLAATQTYLDQQVSATIERVSAPGVGRLSDVLTGELGVVERVAALPGRRIAQIEPVPADVTYSEQSELSDHGSVVTNYWQVGPAGYDRMADGSLRVRPVINPSGIYVSEEFPITAPVGSDDVSLRPLDGRPMRRQQQNYPGLGVVGRFDPTLIRGFNELSGLTSETYAAPLLPGADAASRSALGDRPLAPSSNLAGYAAQPPLLLTTLAGAAPLLEGRRYSGAIDTAPISVIRVRVADVEGPDPASRERLNVAALAIAERTGLSVDIVAGASGVPTTVVLPAGDHGRPELKLVETWARTGVAYEVVEAVDRKSAALFVLILGTCALVVGNAAGAAVRTRRTELGVLSGLGWGPGRLFGVVLGELMLIGLVAGTLGASVAFGLRRVAGLDFDVGRTALAVPVAVGLAALAGVGPALRAARMTPVDAVRPLVWAPRRVRAVHSVLGMAGASLRRTPGRTLVAAASLGIAVAAATLLLAVQQQFRGTVIGTLLGDAVTVQVRTPDLVALATIGLLGTYAVADVLVLAVREQSVELAVLRGSGWSGHALSWLVLAQGLGIGVFGSLVGAAVGVGTIVGFAGSWDPGLLRSAAYVVAAGVGLALVAALVPVLLVRRVPVAALVSEEA